MFFVYLDFLPDTLHILLFWIVFSFCFSPHGTKWKGSARVLSYEEDPQANEKEGEEGEEKKGEGEECGEGEEEEGGEGRRGREEEGGEEMESKKINDN